MSKVQDTLDQQITELKGLRDELRVRAHLFKAEVKDEWHKVEARLDVIESELARFAREAKTPIATAGDAARELILEAKEAMQRIRTRAKNLP